MKSHKLSKARKHLESANIDMRYDGWAKTYRGPHGGLTPAEFNTMTMEYGLKWEDPDLKLIFNALVSDPAWRINSANNQGSEPRIPKEDLINWVQGGTVWL